jgi:hypothetical protein
MIVSDSLQPTLAGQSNRTRPLYSVSELQRAEARSVRVCSRYSDIFDSLIVSNGHAGTCALSYQFIN